MDKPEPRKGTNSTAPYADDPQLYQTFPNLAALMLNSTYANGEHKPPGFVSIKPRDRGFSITAKIDQLGLMLRLQAPTFSEALQAIDALLGTPAPPWVVDPYHEEAENAKKGRKKS